MCEWYSKSITVYIMYPSEVDSGHLHNPLPMQRVSVHGSVHILRIYIEDHTSVPFKWQECKMGELRPD